MIIYVKLLLMHFEFPSFMTLYLLMCIYLLMKTVVKVVDLIKEYNGVKALKGVSLEVYEGEILGLLGPNGAGKSTLMNIIAGVIKPTSGKVEVLGYDVLKNREKVALKIGYCPQETVLYGNLTVMENMMFYAGLYNIPGSEAKKRAKRILEYLGLSGVEKTLAKRLSGGMKRRLNLAVALLNDPELLLLDEPTVGLDPNIRRSVWDAIKRLKEEGKTIILATHYMEEADELSDRVAIMNEGQIVALDTPEALKKMVGPLAAIELEFSKLPENLDKVLGRVDVVEKYVLKNEKVVLYTKDPDTALPQVVSLVIENGGKLARIDVREPTLEDVFVKLTGRGLE